MYFCLRERERRESNHMLLWVHSFSWENTKICPHSGCCTFTKFGKSRVNAVTILELHVHTTGWVGKLQLWYNTWTHHLSCGNMEIPIAPDCWATVRVTEKVKWLGMGLLDTQDGSEDFLITFSGLTSTELLASPLICLCYHMLHIWFNTNTLLSHSHTGLHTYK